jgi:phage tail sheath gpL-like
MSDAVGSERISRVVGYKIEKGDFSTTTMNLPRKIAIFAEGNTANQADFDTTPKVITSAAQAGKLYGFGSPIYSIMRILRPVFGGGIGGIPTVVFPQKEAVGSTNKQISITPVGTATGNGTHYIKIAGRDNVDAEFYAVPILKDDTTADITAKISDAVNAVLPAPVSGTSTDYEATLSTKWKGATANELHITMDVGDNDFGITYTVTTEQDGAGTPSISASLALVGNEWYTEYINSYGTNSTVMASFMAFIGKPDPENPTGKFTAIIMKPGVVITGSTNEDPSDITDEFLNDVAIAIAPAPLSKGFSFEAAANMCLLFSRKAQDNPHQDVGGSYYPDMPTPTDIGLMSDYDERDRIVKKGCSTVDLVAGRYLIEDFVTTYHPLGETPPQFRYVRDLYCVDLNVFFGYYLKEQLYVVDHVIAKDEDIVQATKVIQPKQWKQIIDGYAEDLATRALIADKKFMQDSIVALISGTNPQRINTTFSYKRTAVARISSTTATAGFNFGTV